MACLSAPLFSARGQDKPAVTYDGDNIHVAAPPNWHFLIGKPLQRLKDGATVVYLAQIGLYDDAAFQRPIRLALDRFAISCDVWAPDRFSVALVTGTPRTAGNLLAGAAEAWCLETVAISASNVTPERRFWLKLEMRTVDPRDLASLVAGPGLSLSDLVQRLGKKAGADDPPRSLEAGPLRLADLVRTPGRGPRIG